MTNPKAIIKAVVFDLDDTLYPELDYVRSGFHAASDYLTGPGFDKYSIYKMLWRAFERGPRERVFNTVLEEMDLPADEMQIAALVGMYRSHRPVLHLDERTREVLEQLHEGYRLGVITDGYLPTQRYKVEALGLASYFEQIIYTEELGRQYWKPSPYAFELMTERFASEHSQCVYVGDNVSKDFIAPNQLGWLTVQLKRSGQVHGDAEIPDNGDPQVVIEDIGQLVSVLAE